MSDDQKEFKKAFVSFADYEAIRDEAKCAAGNHLYSTNWKDGKAYDYCPFCGHEPNNPLPRRP
jgi:hypothetical protein